MESQGILSSAPAARPANAITIGMDFLRQAWAAWWCALLTRRARRRTATALRDLDEHVLRDIGAPDWALRESEALRQMDYNRRAHWLWT
ncbi:MAG TPA: hypothetical protein VEA17_21515 [Bordetella sp.]|nr:hypothetical protein [Bordetella sp.]